MYRKLKAEMVIANMTQKDLCQRMNEAGVEIGFSTLSQKMNGKYDFTLPEAFAIQDVLNSQLTLRELFERAS